MSAGTAPRLIKSLVRPAVAALRPYEVPAAQDLLKLDAMESPDPLPPPLKAQWLEDLSTVKLGRYPDPHGTALKQRLRSALAIPPQAELLLGNGSDELIQMIAMAVGGHGRTLLAATPTFSMYEQITVTTGGAFVGVPRGADFAADGAALAAAVARHRAACVFFAHPNNPSGNCDPEDAITAMAAHTLVVVDEAYHPFCGRSLLSRLAQFPDMLVLRTLSKNGLAGLRLGVLIGHPHWLAEIDKVRLPYNISALTQHSAAFYLTHHEAMSHQAAATVARRAELFAELGRIRGVHPYPSEGNFLLLRVAGDADRVHAELIRRGVLIRNLHRRGTPLENCLRVTVGDAAENARFLDALRAAVAAAD